MNTKSKIYRLLLSESIKIMANTENNQPKKEKKQNGNTSQN